MEALFYQGTNDAQIVYKPLPNIHGQDEIILHVISTAICGSHLHVYHGILKRREP
jgi:threonine dehydrogenase-like Zn-dependent dehydrogenase